MNTRSLLVIHIGVVTGVFAFAASSCAAIVAADWSTISNGTISNVSFSITGLSTPGLAVETNQSFIGASYSPAPQSNVDDVMYGAANDWTVSFSAPLMDLYLYARAWRGAYTTTADPTTSYSFSMPFTVLSGMTGSTVSGNTLICPDGAFYSGLLKFSGPVSTLSVTSDGLNESGQVMTFGATVPEPSSLGIALTSVLMCILRRHRRALIPVKPST